MEPSLDFNIETGSTPITRYSYFSWDGLWHGQFFSAIFLVRLSCGPYKFSNLGDFPIFFELPSIIFNGALNTRIFEEMISNYFVGKTKLNKMKKIIMLIIHYFWSNARACHRRFVNISTSFHIWLWELLQFRLFIIYFP